MCGDVDEVDGLEDDLVQRFVAHAHAMLARRPGSSGELNLYLDRLFAELLQRCMADVEAAATSDPYCRLAMQALVLERLAGFLAGHVALREDPLRKLMEAVLMGYGEAEAPAAHEHDHDHPHAHEHPHELANGQHRDHGHGDGPPDESAVSDVDRAGAARSRAVT